MAPDFPIPIVGTGTPEGIWTIERSESNPPNPEVSIGTPITGIGVKLAITPARCAAPHAQAIITSYFFSASVAYDWTLSGERWADMILTSKSNPNSFNIFMASFIVTRSESLPITIPIFLFVIIHLINIFNSLSRRRGAQRVGRSWEVEGMRRSEEHTSEL